MLQLQYIAIKTLAINTIQLSEVQRKAETISLNYLLILGNCTRLIVGITLN